MVKAKVLFLWKITMRKVLSMRLKRIRHMKHSNHAKHITHIIIASQIYS